MNGWKSKYGSIVMALGIALIAGAKVCPDPNIGGWILFAGTILSGGGGGLLGYGIAHKIEKAGNGKINAKELKRITGTLK